MIATKPAAFDATEKNAVTGVGAPSYVSGAHWWNGTAEILKPKPQRMNTIATTSRAIASPSASAAPMSVSFVEPVAP